MAVELTTTNEPVDRVPLFRIDGVEYTIPKKVKANVQLKYLRSLKEEGELAATYVMLEALLGREGYEALMNYENLTEEDFKTIVDIASHIVLGNTETGKA